jgi:putative transposase
VSVYLSSAVPRDQFRLILSSFQQAADLPFADVLSEEQIEQACADEGVEFGTEPDDIYTPPLVLWAFLSQMLFKDEQRSCAAAVARLIAWLTASGQKAPSANTGAYCKARHKLTEGFLRRLARECAERAEERLPEEWLWHGRRVKLVDGTTLSMPDTEANQAQYPQHVVQQPGLGFPIARMVALFSLATAMVQGAAIGPYAGKETGETALFREIMELLGPDELLLADRYYCSYFLLALLLSERRDFAVRLHQRRSVDWSAGERLGRRDHVVTWHKPEKPEWMEQALYDQIPATIRVREVEIAVSQPGFRTRSLVVVTTLLDAEEFPAGEIGELYRRRWQAELNLRAVKVTMGLDVLRAKTPEMVRKELWTGLLAYNLIRRTMLQAAHAAQLLPHQLSFTAALQTIAASWLMTLFLNEEVKVALFRATHLGIASYRIGNRPDRVEPRAIKRRPKPHDWLTEPRSVARAKLLAASRPS